MTQRNKRNFSTIASPVSALQRRRNCNCLNFTRKDRRRI